MKARAYISAALLGASGGAGLACILIYSLSYPAWRHPYSLPFSLAAGCLAAVAAITAFSLLFYYITKLPHGARGKTVFGCICTVLASLIAGFFLFSFAYDTAAEFVHRLDP